MFCLTMAQGVGSKVLNRIRGIKNTEEPNSQFFREVEESKDKADAPNDVSKSKLLKDEMEKAFMQRIRTIEMDNQLQSRIRYALSNWIGTRVSSFTPDTLEVFLLTLERELQSIGKGNLVVDTIRQKCAHSFDSCPYIKLNLIGISPQIVTNYAKTRIQFFVGSNGVYGSQYLPAGQNQSKSQQFFIENLDEDELLVKLFGSSDQLIGKTKVPLKMISSGSNINLSLLEEKTNKNIGSIGIKINAYNPRKDSMREIVSKILEEKLFQGFFPELFGKSLPSDSEVEGLQIDYSVQIFEKQSLAPEKDGATNRSTLRSEFRLNDFSSVLMSNNVVTFKILSLSEDIVEIKLMESRRSSISDHNETNASDQDIFMKVFRVADIPWNEGLTASYNQYTWTVRISGEDILNSKPILGHEQLFEILLLAYYRTLAQLETEAISKWDGKLKESLAEVISCLQPCSTSDAWASGHATSIFMLHKECYPTINTDILICHFPYLQRGNLQDQYKQWCMNQVGAFDARCVKNLEQFKRVIKKIASLYTEQSRYSIDFLSSYLITAARSYVGKVFHTTISMNENEKGEMWTKQLDLLKTKLTGYGYPTLELISTHFGEFGLQTWQPLLAKVIIEVCLMKFKEIFDQAKEVTDDPEINQFHISSFALFNEIRKMNKYTPSIQEVYNSFEDSLPFWAKSAADKAREQVFRVLGIERQKFVTMCQNVDGNSSESDRPAKNTLARRFLKPSLSRESTTSHASLSSALSRRLADDYLEVLEGAINVHGIFSSCNITWLGLKWPDPIKSITKFGAELFCELRNVYLAYVSGLTEIIMADNEFDKSELVFALHSCSHSMKFLDTFSKSMTDEIQRIADKMSDSKTGIVLETDLRMSVREDKLEKLGEAIQKFATIKTETLEEVNKLIKSFCNGQRIQFRELINPRRRDSKTSYSFNDIDESACDYLGSLLQYYQTKLNNELTQDYRNVLMEKLVNAFECELESFFNKNSSTQRLEVFKHLNEMVDITINMRKDFDLDSSKILTELEKKIFIKSASTEKLISMYLTRLHDTKCDLQSLPEEVTGNVVFNVGLLANQLFVSLIGVNELKPQAKRINTNFSLVVSVLPVKIENSYKISKKTLIYPKKTNLLFDIEDESRTKKTNIDPKTFNFEFDLPEMQDKSETFLEICFYDHSKTKMYMKFRGSCLVHFSKIPSIDSKNELGKSRLHEDFTRTPVPENNCCEAWIELSQRKNKLSEEFVEDEEKHQREKKIAQLPRSDEWADHSIWSNFFS